MWSIDGEKRRCRFALEIGRMVPNETEGVNPVRSQEKKLGAYEGYHFSTVNSSSRPCLGVGFWGEHERKFGSGGLRFWRTGIHGPVHLAWIHFISLI